MNKRLLAAWITALTITGTAASAWADPPDCTPGPNVKIFDPEGTEGAWQKLDNWNPEGEPGPNDVACIPSGHTATIYWGFCPNGDQCYGAPCPNECEPARHVQARQVSVDGTLTFIPWTTLTISEDSEVNGKLEGWGRGSLLIDSDSNLTITGDGRIEAYYEEGSCALLQAIIDGAGECSGGDNDGDPCAPCLSTDPCVAGGGTCVPPSPYPTLTLQGSSLELRGRWETCLPLINNASVIADECQNNLIVSADGNTGSGFWIAEVDSTPYVYGPTVLQIEGSVSGSGTWKIESNAKIVINAACTALTGDVNLSHSSAMLDVNQNFSTSGNLEMTGGTITVSTGKLAAFD